MKLNIFILYGSSTGNVESLALFCKKQLQNLSTNCKVINVIDAHSNFKFNDDYNLYLLLSSTWGTDFPCLQEDFEIFWKTVEKSSIKNKKFCIIGLGDSYYPNFCAAADILKADIIKYQGILVNEAIKIQDPWEDSTNNINNYLSSFISLNHN